MEEPPDVAPGPDSQPGHVGPNYYWRPPDARMTKDEESVLRRFEWIAVVLFIVNFVLMIYTISIYYNEENWGKAVAAVSTATAVVLLLSVLFSIFGSVTLSRIAIAIGLFGMMIEIVSMGFRIIQTMFHNGLLGF
jgi:hypothetical protein